MYGLLIENVRILVTEKYGEAVWNKIREKVGLSEHTHSIHNRYSETLIPRIAQACSEITGDKLDVIMHEVGNRFVTFVGQYGYSNILRVLGRTMSSFLNGLDNLHEYLRFSYPKMKPPSFFVDNETVHGMRLHYRSQRKGFVYYVIGQLKEVGKRFYDVDVKVEIEKCEESDHVGCYAVLNLKYDNRGFMLEQRTSLMPCDNQHKDTEFPADIFFDLFPFHISFDKKLSIINFGSGINTVLSDVRGKLITDIFYLTRPLVEFTWQNVNIHTNVVFEMKTKDRIRVKRVPKNGRTSKMRKLHLKGQMLYVRAWEAFLFLGTPIIEDLEEMFDLGLYIDDLSMHDSSRDLVLAGMQQSAELKLALDQEKYKSAMLEESMQKLDQEMKRTDTLLYRMIPKQVADRLRKGEPALNTCETFEKVTILFSDVVGFTTICSKIAPMRVVTMLNEMYTQFDKLSEQHEVYKVETIGDAYMVVSGCPERTEKHAENVADMALDMIQSVTTISNPAEDNEHLKIRIGMHSGTVVAGVVGIKMPRYCLFGDAVNTASRMESTGSCFAFVAKLYLSPHFPRLEAINPSACHANQAMVAHISEPTKNSISSKKYLVKKRGTISVKGKGTMESYWLMAKIDLIGSDSKILTHQKQPKRCPFSADEIPEDETSGKGSIPIELVTNAREQEKLVCLNDNPSPLSVVDLHQIESHFRKEQTTFMICPIVGKACMINEQKLRTLSSQGSYSMANYGIESTQDKRKSSVDCNCMPKIVKNAYNNNNNDNNNLLKEQGNQTGSDRTVNEERNGSCNHCSCLAEPKHERTTSNLRTDNDFVEVEHSCEQPEIDKNVEKNVTK